MSVPAKPSVFWGACYAGVQAGVRALGSLLFGLEVRGREHVPAGGGVLIVANHTSFLDPVLIGSVIRRRLTYFARESLFANPVFGAAIRGFGSMPVARGQVDRKAIAAATEALLNSRALLLFPEGTRGDGGELLPFQRGFLLLVRRTGCPVLPVGVSGAERVLPKKAIVPRLARLRVTIGALLAPDDVLGLGADGLRQTIADLREP